MKAENADYTNYIIFTGVNMYMYTLVVMNKTVIVFSPPPQEMWQLVE